ncbi:MAG: hypothetical protein ABIG93_01500 [archaeon]|nr:hypothetical protein [Nanoarchaeota archaeon]
MAINNWKIWRKFGLVKVPEHETVKPIEDLGAVVDFLKLVSHDVKVLVPELEKLQELEKEKAVAKEGLLQVNLESQGIIFEKILLRYQSLEDDVSVNAIRVKKVAREFLNNCEKAGLKDYAKEKKKDLKWKLRW